MGLLREQNNEKSGECCWPQLPSPPPKNPPEPSRWGSCGRALPVLPTEDKLWLKPYVDLQAYEDPAQGALDFTQELDPGWLIVDTVIGEGEPCGSPLRGSTELLASWSLGCPKGS